MVEWGLTITTIGGLIILIGGYLAWKEEREENVRKTFIHLPEQEPDKDLERYLKKSKAEHKILSVEEESQPEEKRSLHEEESVTDEEKQPPNLQMFD